MDLFLGFCCSGVVLLLKSFSKGFHFGTKIVVLDLFFAFVNFGDCAWLQFLID
jgi:hypothetical protein